jgi:outer membrane protein assembly factor BamD
MHRFPRRLVAALVFMAAAACRPEFQLKNYTTNEALYTASLRAYERHHWDDAAAGFEKLTTDLSPRDTLLPRSYWYLASAHDHMDEHLLAAQSYNRLTETFPEDSLADDAALESARSYRRMWRKPQLDPMYGETALSAYNTLIGLYPSSPLVPAAQKEIAELENWFAIKDYDAGIYYVRRKDPYSAIIYFKDILSRYANTPKAYDSGLALVDVYKKVGYRADATDLCAEVRQRYPSDRRVRDMCTGVPEAPVAKTDSTAAAPKKPPPPSGR